MNNDELSLRVRKLERINRLLFAATAGCLLVLLLSGAGHDGVLRGSAIELISSDGQIRAELVMREGHPGLYLRDDNGVERVALFHNEEATGLYVNDSSTTTRIGIAQFAHGGGGVALHGADSKGAAVLYLKEEGSLRFFDRDGRVTDRVPAGSGEAQ